MPTTFICTNCGKETIRNLRLKKQKFCSEKPCQQARKGLWGKRKYSKNPIYQKLVLEKQKVWRKKHHHDQYQSQYRAHHPEYLDRNRKLQKIRNKKRRKEKAFIEIKKSTLLLHPGENGMYLLSKTKKNMIVNRDALTLQPSINSGYMMFKINNKKDCKSGRVHSLKPMQTSHS